MVAVKSVLLLLALGTESLVASQSVICQSKLGTKSIPASKIPRATTTIHSKVTVQKKVIRKVNVVVVPRPTTTTSTEVKTITETTQADPDIETAIETKTDTRTTIEVRLHTTTSTSISSTTTTRYTTTSTILAPAGFTPAKGPDWRPKIKARDTLKERSAPDVFLAGLQSNPEYVQRIDCTKKVLTTSVKVTTITVKGTRVTANPKTKTKVVTSITTTIETQYPPKVTETSFETTTSTVTEYDDRTETVTVETVIPVDYYEACGDTNMLRTANGGNKISSLSYKFTSMVRSTSGLKNAYECCVLCQQTSSCFFSNWRVNSLCALYLPITTDICSNGQQVAATYYTSATTNNDWVLSNGQCGKLTNGSQ
ncbi:hypothetical protein FOC4_g10004950 [Fusarium odoratissimum]|uniref:Apple domain-containing protein n=3 Tax=Fusarium oxysporum species complex TaxID=171631 RepID=N1RQG6_FUSC4|nr:uncharacterized protein FOIG_10040 [Fusarium odoratissimum NRRL 54006]EMT68858.1 hypothetical protein FOC4_g10004950 [Fusarium odoratissimum]EXL97720.1 hypothetical protein FOIG_10040 [Fusarium odoratissimum NRRL 54006]TXB96443.1 hypothetical protein FocTR4_00011250 [Fusarium oxysporum f. sp. cubense]